MECRDHDPAITSTTKPTAMPRPTSASLCHCPSTASTGSSSLTARGPATRRSSQQAMPLHQLADPALRAVGPVERLSLQQPPASPATTPCWKLRHQPAGRRHSLARPSLTSVMGQAVICLFPRGRPPGPARPCLSPSPGPCALRQPSSALISGHGASWHRPTPARPARARRPAARSRRRRGRSPQPGRLQPPSPWRRLAGEVAHRGAFGSPGTSA